MGVQHALPPLLSPKAQLARIADGGRRQPQPRDPQRLDSRPSASGRHHNRHVGREARQRIRCVQASRIATRVPTSTWRSRLPTSDTTAVSSPETVRPGRVYDKPVQHVRYDAQQVAQRPWYSSSSFNLRSRSKRCRLFLTAFLERQLELELLHDVRFAPKAVLRTPDEWLQP